MEEATPAVVPARQYTCSLDEFLVRNRLPIRSRPFAPTHFPELNYMVPKDFPFDMRIFDSKKYHLEDPYGIPNIEEGNAQLFVVSSEGKRIASLDLCGSRVINGDISDFRNWTDEWNKWYWVVPINS